MIWRDVLFLVLGGLAGASGMAAGAVWFGWRLAAALLHAGGVTVRLTAQAVTGPPTGPAGLAAGAAETQITGPRQEAA